jgi:carbamoyl-phosphate synthase large subunit
VSRGVQVLGTSVEAIDVAENRKRFERLLRELNIPQPKGTAVTSIEEALDAAHDISYPVLVRPSYVIGGRAMMIVYNDEELSGYVQEATELSSEHPILIDEYIEGQEVEVDAICDREDILIPGIMEHIERTGVHSGDSFCVYPPQTLEDSVIDTIIEYTKKISIALQVSGLVNIQFVVRDHKVYIIEVNPRASRTVPILSKVTKIPMVQIAMEVILGKRLQDLKYGVGLLPSSNLIAVKAPVFSFVKLHDVDAALTPEMKSTGEVLGIDSNYEKALLKAFLGAGFAFPKQGNVLISVADKAKDEVLKYAKTFQELGFGLMATAGTVQFLESKGMEAKKVDGDDLLGVQEQMKNKTITMMINIPTKGKDVRRAGFKLRSLAEHLNIPNFTCLDTVDAYIKALKTQRSQEYIDYDTIDYYM